MSETAHPPGAEEKEIRKLLSLKPEYPLAHITMGMIYLIKDEPDQAILQLKETIKIAKGNESLESFAKVVAHYYLGNAFQKKGLNDLAAYQYKEVLKFDADAAPAHVGLGQIYLVQNDFDKAANK